MSIPRKIHYVWLGDQPLPPKDEEYIKEWQRLNPDFEIRRWTEKDIDLKKYPLVKKALDEKQWAFAADIIRMYAVYKEGGIYLDTDIELVKPLESLLKYKAFACFESNFWFTTAVFGAEKHSPWIGKILKRYELGNVKQKINTNTYLKTVHSSSVYAKDYYDLQLDGKKRVYNDEFLTLSSDYFCPKHYMTGEMHRTKNTMAIHHYASTWHSLSERIKNVCLRGVYGLLGARGFAFLEKNFNKSMERKIRKELP
ncbi:glycosyl transferase [Candidatus Saccharibacteria bacterium]|nr:glycosyl transferase [Candidatus Saccharibacteria bacterium]